MDGEKYERHYDRFAANLQRLTADRGVQLGRPPLVNGIRQDLFKLYRVVTSLGGFEKVDDQNQWKEVAQAVGFPPGSCNVEVVMRKIYAKYLLSCESAIGFGDEDEEIVEVVSESQPWTRSKSVSLAASTAPRTAVHASQNTKSIAEECYDSLILALLSGLPNEVDVAMNACLMLSYDDDNPFFLAKAPQLIPLLLSHVGVFNTPDMSTYQTLPYHAWPTQGGPVDSSKKRRHDLQTEAAPLLTMDDCIEDASLFSEGTGDWLPNDWMQFRIEQVLTILNNLSMMEDNAYYLSQSMAYLQLLLWCVDCKQSSLKWLAADSLTQIAHEVVLKVTQSSFNPHLIIQSLCYCLISSDRLLQLKGLEVLSKLCTVEGNDDVLYTELDERVYESILKSLIVPDVELLVAALETLYQLTSLGSKICSVIITFHGLVDMLSSLLTFQIESLGKAVPEANPAVMDEAVSRSVQLTLPIHQRPELLSITTAPVQIQLASLSEVSGLLKCSRANVIAPHSYVQVLLDSSPNRAEAEARKWLLDSYIVDQFGSVPMMKMYSHYVEWASHKNMKRVVKIELLNKLVKSLFPGSDSKPVGNEQNAVVSGISSKLQVDQDRGNHTAEQVSSQSDVHFTHAHTVAGVIPSLLSTTQDENPVTSLRKSTPSNLSADSSNIDVLYVPVHVGCTSAEMNSHKGSLSQSPQICTPSCCGGESVVSVSRNCLSKPTINAISHVDHSKDITSVVMANKTPVMTARLGPSLETDSRCNGTQLCSQVTPSSGEGVDGLHCKVDNSIYTLPHTHSEPAKNSTGICDCGICPLSQAAVSWPTASAVSAVCSDKGVVEPPAKQPKTECNQSMALSANTSAHGLCPCTAGLSCERVDGLCSSKDDKSETGPINCVLERPQGACGLCVVTSITNCNSSLHNKPHYCNTCQTSTSLVLSASSSSSSCGLLRTNSQQTASNCSPTSVISLQSLHQSEKHKTSRNFIRMEGKSLQTLAKQNTTLNVLPIRLSAADNKQSDTNVKTANEESSITKTVRLTAAVVIRNLLIHSPLAVRKFAVLEGLFLELSQLPLEAAGVLAECLYVLSNRTECQT